MTVCAITSTSVDLPVSDVWLIEVEVRDVDGCFVDEVPVVTVTLPAGTTSTPTVETVITGLYRVAYVVGTTGRYVARAVTTAYGAADFTAYVTATVAATAMPSLDDLRGDPLDEEDQGYLGETSATDAEIQDALNAEAAAQRATCRVPAAYPDDLRQALLRRVARNLALRGIPLAVLRGDAESGDTVLPGRDPEVRRLEGPHRKLTFG